MKNWIKIIKLCVLAMTVAGIMGLSGPEKISAGVNACTHEGGGVGREIQGRMCIYGLIHTKYMYICWIMEKASLILAIIRPMCIR